MKSTVMIKGSKSGIILVLDEKLEFSKLQTDVAKKIKESAKFLGKTHIALQFQGRTLSDEEVQTLIKIIEDNSRLKIACVIEDNEKQEEKFKKNLDQALSKMNDNSGQFYKGNLRSGQVLESESSIVVIGDVNAGAKVVSKGNIIIIGNLKGNVFAGAGGNKRAFVLALGMQPIQIRIADFIARAPDKEETKGIFKDKASLFYRKKSKKSVQDLSSNEMKIAFVDGEKIMIEPLNKDVLNEIKF